MLRSAVDYLASIFGRFHGLPELPFVIEYHTLETRTALDSAVPFAHRSESFHWKFDQLEAMNVDTPSEVGKREGIAR
jgi:hypothetical protein